MNILYFTFLLTACLSKDDTSSDTAEESILIEDSDTAEEPENTEPTNDESLPTEDNTYHPERSILENLDHGVPILELLSHHEETEFYGLEYQGGYIFHIDASTGLGMVVHPLPSPSPIHWQDYEDVAISFALGTAIGTGKSNTQNIVAGLGDYEHAAQQAHGASINGYDDWFLPSFDELHAIYERLHRSSLVTFPAESYWSSSDDNTYAWVIYFYNGNQYTPSKFHPHHYVLPVREF